MENTVYKSGSYNPVESLLGNNSQRNGQVLSSRNGFDPLFGDLPILLEDPVETLEILETICAGFTGQEVDAFYRDFQQVLTQLITEARYPSNLSTCFLLHGAKLPDPENSIEKIKKNLEVILASRTPVNNLIDLNFAVELEDPLVKLARSIHDDLRTSQLRVTLRAGMVADVANGLVLRLYSDNARCPTEFIAQTSLYFEPQQGVAYLLNLQGCHSKEYMQSEINGQFMGKQYARWQHLLGKSPKSKLVELALQICSFLDCESLKAVRPEHHPYYYIAHRGFKGNYSEDLISAGIHQPDKKDPEIYLTCKL